MAEFMLVAMNQVVNEAPRLRYMSGGQVKVPLVLKAGYGFTAGWAGQHTGSIYTMFAGIPGLKVVLPSTPADAKGLMAARRPRRQPGRLPHALPAGARARRRARGRVPGADRRGGGPPRRQRRDDRRHRLDGRQGAGGGRDAGRRGHRGRGDRPAHAAAARHADDPRRRSRRPAIVVLADQATRHASAASIIAAEVAEHGFSSLRAPIKLVTALDATIPYSEPMEAFVLPDEAQDRRRGRAPGRWAPRRSPPAGLTRRARRGQRPWSETAATCWRRCGASAASRSASRRLHHSLPGPRADPSQHRLRGRRRRRSAARCATTTPSTAATAPTATRWPRGRRWTA